MALSKFYTNTVQMASIYPKESLLCAVLKSRTRRETMKPRLRLLVIRVSFVSHETVDFSRKFQIFQCLSKTLSTRTFTHARG